MDKLFRVLLNRKPNYNEKKNILNKNHNEINNYILQLPEYKEFLELNSNNVKDIIKNNFNSQNSRFHLKLMDILRNNNYNINKVHKYINEIKTEIRNKVDLFIFEHIDKKVENINYQIFYDIFFKNNFDYKQFEFIVVNSNIFHKLVAEEINNFYLENNIKY